MQTYKLYEQNQNRLVFINEEHDIIIKIGGEVDQCPFYNEIVNTYNGKDFALYKTHININTYFNDLIDIAKLLFECKNIGVIYQMEHYNYLLIDHVVFCDYDCRLNYKRDGVHYY